MIDMNDKVVIVSGATGGQGEAEVRLLVECGAQVVFGGRNEENGRAIEADLRGRAIFQRHDVGSEAEWAAIVERAGAELALLVSATRFRLGWPAGEPMPVSYSGGALNAEPLLAAFSRRLHDLGDPVDLRRPLLAPDLGAALHAARLAGHPVDQDAVARLSAHPTPAVA